MANFGKLALFHQSEKRNEKSPDYTGTLEVSAGDIGELVKYLNNADEEEDYQGNWIVKLSVSAWINESKSGKKYLKGSFSEPYRPDAVKPASVDTLSDPAPF